MYTQAEYKTEQECGVLHDLDFLVFTADPNSSLYDISLAQEKSYRAVFNTALRDAFAEHKDLLGDDVCEKIYQALKEAVMQKNDIIRNIVLARSFKFSDLFNKNADREKADKVRKLKQRLSDVRRHLTDAFVAALPHQILEQPVSGQTTHVLKDKPTEIYNRIIQASNAATSTYRKGARKNDWNIAPFIGV